MDFFSAIFGVSFPVLIAYFSWDLKQKNTKKRKGYEKLIYLLNSFYENKKPADRQKFIDEYRNAFLYASDDVLKSINNFFESVKVGKNKNAEAEDKEEMFSKIVIEMRKDILSSMIYKSVLFLKNMFSVTQLTYKDVKHIKAI
jgi:hypothetical protein